MRKIFACILASVICGNISAQTAISNEEQRKLDYYFYEAMDAKALGKIDATFDFLSYCHQIDSTNANVLFELGDYFRTADKQSKAMSLYRKATSYDKDNFYYMLAYAGICFELKQYTEAIDQYEALITKNPDNTDLYLYLSEANRMEGNLPKAIEALDKLEQIIGLNEKISLQKFQLYSMMKQENKAFLEIQKYIQKYPTETRYQVLLGNLYMRAGKTKEAYLAYSQAKAIDPEDPYLISSMASYYEETNNKAAAEDELRTALISSKVDVDSKLSILSQYVTTLQQNKKKTVVVNALFDTLMMQHPQEPKLNMMYGNLLMIQDKKNEARFQYQIFAESNPTNTIGWEQMLSTAFPDSVDLTIKICKEAISYIPDQPQFYFYQGLAQYLKKDYNDALATMLVGVKYVDGENDKLMSDFYGQIGDLYQHMENLDSAFVAYDKALYMNGNNIAVLNNYSYYLSLAKKIWIGLRK